MSTTKWRDKTLLLLIVSIALAEAGVAVSGTQANKQPDKPPAVTDNLQGTWKEVSAAVFTPTDLKGENKPLPRDVWKGEWVFTADKIIFKAAGQSREVTYKLDPSKNPKAIDISPYPVFFFSDKVPDLVDGTCRGIYRLKGDTLELYYSQARRERPAGFEAQPDVLVLATVLGRQPKQQ